MTNLPPGLIRPLAFLRKEIVEVIRQPMLVVTLVLGPFLILLFFGIGYRNEPRALRTIFVVENDSGLARQIEQYAATLGEQLIYSGVTDNLETAQAMLQRGEVDLITVVPSNAYETVRENQQVVIALYHREIDPFQIDYVNVFGRVYVDEINRRILRRLTSEGQVDMSAAQAQLQMALESVVALQEVLERCIDILTDLEQAAECDSEATRPYLADLDRSVDELDLALGDNVRLNEAIEVALGDEAILSEISPTTSNLETIVQEVNDLSGLGETVEDYLASLETLIEMEDELLAVQSQLDEFLALDPRILISPFRSEARNIAAVIPQVTDFFAPAVIVLLLQHLAVTFAALSMVREQQLGTMELFFVAPISALETLLGKYLSYLIFGGVLAIVLLLLIVFGLGVPVLGSWLGIAVVITAFLFTAMGIGFVISLVSSTDIQAVQYAMIVLLTSVFFSGFFLSLEVLWDPVKIISWSLPATYGIALMRDLMLRGSSLDAGLLLQMLAIGGGLFLLAWWLLRRSMVRN